jgi:hypothetical protein
MQLSVASYRPTHSMRAPLISSDGPAGAVASDLPLALCAVVYDVSFPFILTSPEARTSAGIIPFQPTSRCYKSCCDFSVCLLTTAQLPLFLFAFKRLQQFVIVAFWCI